MTNRCHHCGQKRTKSTRTPRAWLFSELSKDAEGSGVRVSTLVDSGCDAGMFKNELLEAVRTAESNGEITIDKDWKLHDVRRTAKGKRL